MSTMGLHVMLDCFEIRLNSPLFDTLIGGTLTGDLVAFPVVPWATLLALFTAYMFIFLIKKMQITDL